MFLLDTNIVSELTKPRPSSAVLSWLSKQSDTALSVITLQELTYGAELAVEPKRGLYREWVENLRGRADLRILPFDDAAALQTGRLLAQCRQRGRAVSAWDAQIAGIALSRTAVLVTRNMKDFEGLGIALLNPFDSLSE